MYPEALVVTSVKFSGKTIPQAMNNSKIIPLTAIRVREIPELFMVFIFIALSLVAFALVALAFVAFALVALALVALAFIVFKFIILSS